MGHVILTDSGDLKEKTARLRGLDKYPCSSFRPIIW
jgi:hypothetical protein